MIKEQFLKANNQKYMGREVRLSVRNFLASDVKIKTVKIPKMMIAGLIAVIFLYVSVAGIVSVTTPWLARGDTRQHVDYTWRLSHGDIPKWSDGIQYPPFVKLIGYKPEAASANPPLFYMIHAPIIGPMLDRGHWQGAIALGRAVNIFIGILCVGALAWAGWVFGGSRKALFTVAVPALAVLMYRFTRLNVDYALDVLIVLWASLSLIISYKLLQKGLQKKYIVALAIITILGMATKAPYIVFMLISLLAVVMGAVINNKRSIRKEVVRGLLISTGIFVLVLLSIGWFYVRNFKLYGNWFSSSPPGYTGGRHYQSLMEVLANKKLWGLLYKSYSSGATLSIVITSFAVAGWFSITRKNITGYFKDKAMAGIVLLMALAFTGTLAIQIRHAVGIGSINFRYMLPAILPISLFLSYGLLKYQWARGQIFSLAVLAMGASSISVAATGKLHNLYTAASQNDVPTVIVTILLSLFILGFIIFSLSLFALTGVNKNTTKP